MLPNNHPSKANLIVMKDRGLTIATIKRLADWIGDDTAEDLMKELRAQWKASDLKRSAK